MPVKGPFERYLIKPGAALDLGKIGTSDKSLFEQVTKDSYQPVHDRLQEELRELQKMLYAQNKHRVLVVIQAMDTGGKDGCIKGVFSGIDPQGIRVQSFKKPSEEELARDFLWRVHQQVPRNGSLVIFNRSHYEDIIAVRVKKIFGEEVWKRRQRHVIDFERMLAEEGTTIVKVFLHISKGEQKKRQALGGGHPQRPEDGIPENRLGSEVDRGGGLSRRERRSSDRHLRGTLFPADSVIRMSVVVSYGCDPD